MTARAQNNADQPNLYPPSSGRRASASATSRKRGANGTDGQNGQVLPELKKVEFFVAAPEATSVKLAADFTDWEKHPVEMMHSPDGFWFTVVPLPPGNYSYRFLVDGEWWDDPSAIRRAPNPFGTENAILQVE